LDTPLISNVRETILKDKSGEDESEEAVVAAAVAAIFA
jgi:hypothetical protein